MMLVMESERSWPLNHDLTAASQARRRVAEFLADRARDTPADEDLADAITLIASELAVNAVRHGAAPAILRLRSVGEGIHVSVQGASPDGDPALQSTDEFAPSGRGLAIVARLAQDWGWDRDGDTVTVWALV